MRGIFLHDRQFDRDEQFLRGQHRLVNSSEEIPGRYSPLAALAANNNGCIQRDHASRQFGSGVGMREAAAEGPPVADSRMRDMRDRFRQQRRVRCNFGRSQEIDMARQRTDAEDAAPHRDSAQFGDLANIDDQFGRDQTQVHRGHQALAARQHLRPVAVRDEQFQCVRDAGCSCVAESRGFHRRPPRPDSGVFFGN